MWGTRAARAGAVALSPQPLAQKKMQKQKGSRTVFPFSGITTTNKFFKKMQHWTCKHNPSAEVGAFKKCSRTTRAVV